jgi:hypothetical protein
LLGMLLPTSIILAFCLRPPIYFQVSFSGGTEANQILCRQFSSAVSAAVEDVDIGNNDILSSIERQYLILQVSIISP